MFDSLRNVVLRITRVPGEPHPPLGAPGSVRIFRAGKNYYNLRLFAWGFTQFGAVIGIMFSLWFLRTLDTGVAELKQEREKAIAAESAKAAQPPAVQPAPGAVPAPETKPAQAASATKAKVRRNWRQSDGVARGLSHWPAWLIPLLHWIEYGAIFLFLCQIPVTFAATRLEYEQHWYIVTDRSLRIRTGLFSLQESTMSFANLQQVEVQQGPLQRVLGLANVRVQSAGGGATERPGHAGDSLHTGVFHGVENANEIRDLILERLRRFRQAGLGDPDDHGHAPEVSPVREPANGDALAAAREVLVETRALRAALG